MYINTIMVTKDNINFNVQIGEKIRQFRKEKRYPLSVLARAMQISYQQLQKYETGTNRISAEKLAEIANVLGIEIGSFFVSEGPANSDINHKIAQLRNERSQTLLTLLVEHFAALECAG